MEWDSLLGTVKETNMVGFWKVAGRSIGSANMLKASAVTPTQRVGHFTSMYDPDFI